MLKKIAYTFYPVTDMDRALEFYQNVLGFNLLFRQDEWAEFEIGGQRLALHRENKTQNDPASSRAIVSFEARPIEKVIDSLKTKGVHFIGSLEVYPYGKLATFMDPDDNLLGLYEPPGASTRRGDNPPCGQRND